VSKTRKKPLRIGFIGAGGIAELQLRLLAKRQDVIIVALADVNPDTLEHRAQALPDAALYRDHTQMLRSEKLDAVSVCTPNILHMQPTIDALKAGHHVLCEKPMAMTVTEAKRMIKAASTAKKKLVIGFQYRYDPRTQYLRQAMDEGQFGKILYGRVQAMRRRGIPNWGVFGRKALQGGGPLIDIGVHVLEMTHYTMGAPKPVSASADMFTYLGNRPSSVESVWPNWDHETYDVEDLAVGRIRFDTGAVIHIESAFAAHIAERSLMNFQLMGERGGATWEPTLVFTDESGHMVDKKPAWLADTTFDSVFERKMNGFVDHVLYNQPTIAPAKAGLEVQAMLNALYTSAERGGKEVAIRY
jgi:predicted dehydrogenase